MSKSDAPDSPDSFDDFPEGEATNDGNDGSWIELEPGEEVTGKLTGFSPTASYNGVVEIDGTPHRLNATLRKQIVAALLEGRHSHIAIRKEEEETSAEIDGEEKTWHNREVRVL